ncbi:MAG: sodium:solute symporter family protein [Planctomycetaceae bacterium]|nr:sodium:solute symporter family protein [Planctomycetaceae bacterium]
MTPEHYIGAAIVLLIITATGLYSGRRITGAKDFSTGGKKGGVGIVAGTITGTLVGGASTIGTAQLAVVKGFSAWWFTLGAGLGCLVLAFVFTRPLHQAGVSTLSGIFAAQYGKRAGLISTVLMSLGNILTIVAQILSGVALVTSMTNIDPVIAAVATTILMLAYVVFGGVWGTGLVGIVKLLLLGAAVLLCGGIALVEGGGPVAMYEQLPHQDYFNLVARGAGVDLGAGLSLIVGVLTTQTYLQAVISARGVKEGVRGALLSGLVIPPVGVMCIFVGMYVKLHHPEWGILSALPAFVFAYLPPLVAGMILATLLVTLVGTGAGIALGISSMFCRDIYQAYINKDCGDATLLTVSRLGIVVVLGISLLMTAGSMGAMILDCSFIAMGLRGAVAFAPLCCALFFPGRIHRCFVEIGMFAGPLCVVLGNFLMPKGIDPLFYGILASLIAMLAGFLFNRRPQTP